MSLTKGTVQKIYQYLFILIGPFDFIQRKFIYKQQIIHYFTFNE